MMSSYTDQVAKLSLKSQSQTFTTRDLHSLDAYINYIRDTKPESPAELKLKGEALQVATRVYNRVKVTPKPAREGGRSNEGLHTPPAKKHKKRKNKGKEEESRGGAEERRGEAVDRAEEMAARSRFWVSPLVRG